MKRLLAILVTWAAGVGVACVALVMSLRVDPAGEGRERVVSAWKQGRRVARAVVGPGAPLPHLDCDAGCTLAVERVADEGPVLARHPAVLAVSLVPARDGLKVTWRDRTEYLTPDDLVACGAVAGWSPFGEANIEVGLGRIDLAVQALAKALGTSAETLLAEGDWRRVALRPDPEDGRAPYGRPVPVASIDAARLRVAIAEAAGYLARHVRDDGAFTYWVEAPTAKRRPGYSFPRHGGAALFLAEAASVLRDPAIREAAIRTARHLREKASVRCGSETCIGTSNRVDVGSAGVAVLVYVELARDGVDEFVKDIAPLTAFIRSQQRPDGQLMHFYDRKRGRPIDQQTQYYSGEAALALARAYEITRDPADLEAASRVVAYMTGPGWDFFGSRYFFANEHWTCQAVEALQPHAPDAAALDFCLRYTAFADQLQTADGAFDANPMHVPRITDTGSRTEASTATLVAASMAGADAAEIARIESQARRSFAFLLGHQLTPGPAHLMARPDEMRGGLPGSRVDLSVRIDFPQHAGSAMVRYVRYLERPR